MSEKTKFEAQEKKLNGLCEEHSLTYRFIKDRYPISFTIRPLQGVGEQLSMLEVADEDGHIGADAYMRWVFADNELKQIVDEYRKFPYVCQMAILASRKYLCPNKKLEIAPVM